MAPNSLWQALVERCGKKKLQYARRPALDARLARRQDRLDLKRKAAELEEETRAWEIIAEPEKDDMESYDEEAEVAKPLTERFGDAPKKEKWLNRLTGEVKFLKEDAIWWMEKLSHAMKVTLVQHTHRTTTHFFGRLPAKAKDRGSPWVDLPWTQHRHRSGARPERRSCDTAPSSRTSRTCVTKLPGSLRRACSRSGSPCRRRRARAFHIADPRVTRDWKRADLDRPEPPVGR